MDQTFSRPFCYLQVIKTGWLESWEWGWFNPTSVAVWLYLKLGFFASLEPMLSIPGFVLWDKIRNGEHGFEAEFLPTFYHWIQIQLHVCARHVQGVELRLYSCLGNTYIVVFMVSLIRTLNTLGVPKPWQQVGGDMDHCPTHWVSLTLW